MDRKDEWNHFLMNLRNKSWEEFRETREFAYRRQRREYLDGLLEDNLTEDQKNMVDEVIWELEVADEHEGNELYEQGMRDCVWMLKTLGVLS